VKLENRVTGSSMKPKTPENLLDYLDDHLRYERQMLGFTFELVYSLPTGLLWNAIFESFAIHARNLYDFFRHEGNAATSYRAVDYVPGRSKSDCDLKFNELDTLLHLSASRLTKEKVNSGDVLKLGRWLDDEWKIWALSLKDPYIALVDANPVCSVPRVSFAWNGATTTASASESGIVTLGKR
jgi:hypothetical protein